MMSTKVKELNLLQNCVNELNTTNSKNEKQEILAKYPELKNYFLYIHNSYWQYNVTSKNIEKRIMSADKYQKRNISKYDTLFDLLNALKERKITGHDAIDSVDFWIYANCEMHRKLVYKIIDKNLEVRMSEKSINKVFPNLIPTFNVALANKYEDHEYKIKDIAEYYQSRKLDGIRCIIRIENNDVKFFSRKGKEFHTLSKIKEDILNNNIDDCVLDGELCIIGKDGLEDFSAIAKEYNKKNHTIQNPMFIMFDKLTIKEFDDETGTRALKERINDYEDFVLNNSLYHIHALAQVKCISKEQMLKNMEAAVKNNWEGLILRKDIGYEGKRSRYLLKVKKFNDAEYVVENIQTGPFRVINKETGLETTIQTMTNVIIRHKGNTVSVGSGFSLDQRKLFYDNPDLILDKEITVAYFEECKDKNGDISLRFPTVKYVYKNGRET